MGIAHLRHASGLGGQLCWRLSANARSFGYEMVRLNAAPFIQPAHRL